MLEKAWPCLEDIQSRLSTFLQWLVDKSLDQQRKQLNEAHQTLRHAAYQVFLLSAPAMTIPYLLSELKKSDVSSNKIDLSIACLCLRTKLDDKSLVEQEKELLRVILDKSNLPSWEKSPLLFNELLSLDDYGSLMRTLLNDMPSQQWHGLHIFFTKKRHSNVHHAIQTDIISRIVKSIVQRKEQDREAIVKLLKRLFEAPSVEEPIKVDAKDVLVRQILLFEELLKAGERDLLKSVIG